MKRSTNILVFALLIGSSFLLFWAGIDNDHDWGDDFAGYIMQAQSLVQGTSSAFVAANRITMEQSSYFIGPIAYPWGFPVLLAPIYGLFGVNMLAFKSLNIVCYLFFLALLWFAWPRCHSDIGRFVFVSLFAWNPYFQEFMNQVLSDVPFLLFSTFSVILTCRVAVERRWLISKLWDRVLLGLVIAASCFIRANGFLLVVTLMLTLFISAMQNILPTQGMPSVKLAQLTKFLLHVPRTQSSKRWMLVLSCVSLFLAVLVWQVLWSNEYFSILLLSYLKPLTMSLLLERIHYNIELPANFFTGVPHQALVYGATIPFAIAGMFQRRGSDYPMILYAGLTVLLYVLMSPTSQGLRYLFPILPLYVHFVLVGIERIVVVNNPKPVVPRTLVRLVPAFLVLFFFVRTSTVNAIMNHTPERPKPAGPYLPTAQQVFSFISQSTEHESLIVFFKPRAMKLFADRQSILIKEASQLKRGDYLCVYLRKDADDQVKSDDIARLLKEGQLSLVYQNVDFRIYRISKSHNKREHAERENGRHDSD
jgi:hypothetical protein